MKIVLRPDCADLPYFLRAYFAFKMGLPFGYSKCSRGGGGRAPQCPQWFSIQNAEAAARGPFAATPRAAAPSEPAPKTPGAFLSNIWNGLRPDRRPNRSQQRRRLPPTGSEAARARGVVRPVCADRLANGVHSGSARTALGDNNTDYYPGAAHGRTRCGPGTVYADPYGHILMIVRRVAQSDSAAGVILAVDGQPDGTVARKRFWRGNFLFAQDPALGGPGFKRFRPIVRDKNGALRRLTNDEIAKNPQYADFSLDQSQLGVEDFYDRMDDVMSPSPLDPLRAMKEAITSLDEQVKARVTSVENGRKFQNSGRGDASMPDGAAIFETSRRVGGFLDAVARPAPVDRDRRGARISGSRRAAARALRDADGQERRRGQGRIAERARVGACGAQVLVSAQRRLAVDARAQGRVDRVADLEMAYNPNDCVELRWGAPPTATRPRPASATRRRRSARR